MPQDCCWVRTASKPTGVVSIGKDELLVSNASAIVESSVSFNCVNSVWCCVVH